MSSGFQTTNKHDFSHENSLSNLSKYIISKNLEFLQFGLFVFRLEIAFNLPVSEASLKFQLDQVFLIQHPRG